METALKAHPDSSPGDAAVPRADISEWTNPNQDLGVRCACFALFVGIRTINREGTEIEEFRVRFDAQLNVVELCFQSCKPMEGVFWRRKGYFLLQIDGISV